MLVAEDGEHCVRLSLNFLDIGMWAGTTSPSPLPKECQYVLYTPGAPIQGHSCRSLLSCISPMTASVCVCVKSFIPSMPRTVYLSNKYRGRGMEKQLQIAICRNLWFSYLQGVCLVEELLKKTTSTCTAFVTTCDEHNRAQ